MKTMQSPFFQVVLCFFFAPSHNHQQIADERPPNKTQQYLVSLQKRRR